MSVYVNGDTDLFGSPTVRERHRDCIPESDFDRFISKVDKGAECWLWTGAINRDIRYGRFNYQGFVWFAHRFAYTALVGDIPEGLFIDHLCGVRECVNPNHLEPVTPGENARRRPRLVIKSRAECHACGQAIPKVRAA